VAVGLKEDIFLEELASLLFLAHAEVGGANQNSRAKQNSPTVFLF
jgi:hypothetical protein